LDFYPNGHPEKYAKLAFKVFDTDKSGTISFDEFVIVTVFSVRGQDAEKALDFAFDLFDVDKNGKIDRKEFTTLLIAIYELNNIEIETKSAKTIAKEMFKEYDQDNNKSLDKNEFLTLIKSDQIFSKFFNIHI
jgi:Ca2+-binding EF-hand superfamily protein